MSTADATTQTPPADVARRYFAAIARQDLDEAATYWEPGSIDHLAPVGELRVPDEWRQYFEQVFAAMPDFTYDVLDVVVQDKLVAVRWQTSGTFTGRPFQGIRATGTRIRAEGVDFLVVEGGLIRRLDSYWDDASVGRQIGLLPPRGSRPERLLTALFNVRTAIAAQLMRRA
jgi:steroid delta-isomerase-like uncharacterized protein